MGIMRNALLATASLAFVSSPALAADQMSVGVGGYMEQWFGMADRSDKDDKGKAEEGGWDAQGDAEIHFKGSLESDMGLKFTVHVELEGDQGANHIDESFASVSGGFGQLEFGARDHAMVRLHSGISDVGIGLTSGDTQKWVPGTYLETAGHAIGNARKLNYISPRVSGLQVGVSYAPDDSSQAPTSAPMDNDNAGWGAAANFSQPLGDGTVTFSLGHKSTDSAGAKVSYMPDTAPATGAGSATDTRLSLTEYAADKKNIADYEKIRDLTPAKAGGTVGTTVIATAHADAAASQNAIIGATKSMTKGDASTYTNAGVGVSFGAFKFNIAYATSDGGAYTAKEMPVKMTAQEMFAHAAALGGTATPLNAQGVPVTDADNAGTVTQIIDTTRRFDHDKDGCAAATACTTGKFSTASPGTAGVFESQDTDDQTDGNQVRNDSANETWMTSKVVEDKSKNADVWGVSVTYTDGPMAVSLGHMMHEDDAGGERTASMLSASYTLAPGVSWRTSVFGVEDTTSHKNVTGGENKGTGFVTGIKIGF